METNFFSPFDRKKCGSCGHLRIEHLFSAWSNCTHGDCECLRFSILKIKVADKPFCKGKSKNKKQNDS